MYFSRKAITEYPYHGVFYTVKVEKPEDGDLLGDGNLLDGDLLGGDETDVLPDAGTTEDNEENTETSGETILFETECDIQQAAKMFNSGIIMADYNVFFPWKHGEILPFSVGDMFKCPAESYGMFIGGRVTGVEVSQLNGVKVNIKMSEF